MFKTSFSKYLTAFVIIIIISFSMVSGIITSIIDSYVTTQKEEKLKRASGAISMQIEKQEIEDLDTFVKTPLASMVITPVLNYESEFDVLVLDNSGKIILSTVGMDAEGKPSVSENLGTVNTELFGASDKDGFRISGKKILDSGSERSLSVMTEVQTGGTVRGYIVATTNTDAEDQLIVITKRAVFNSSVWVMFAAVIATYFITERIIHPLRTMTGAAKSFAKGDFSARITVYGNDEVSELARAFNNMAESLDNLEKMRNSFLASISHDLRTPMTTISGFIEGITSGAIPPEKHEYYLGVISAEVHRLSRLVSQLLDVSRLESGDRKFNFSDFDVAEMARIILISFEQKIEDKKLDVAFECEEDSVIVHADKDAIHQVLYNLCHNAIKFAREGGRFVIRIAPSDKKVQITVYDEGVTVSKEEENMIFDRFYKSDQSRGLDKTGVGLGLYIAKTIVEAHGESISAASDGEGTEFKFTLKRV